MCLRLMEIYDQSSSMVTWAVFHTRHHVASIECFKRGTLGDSSDHISRSEWLRKYFSYEADIFFQNRQKFVETAKM